MAPSLRIPESNIHKKRSRFEFCKFARPRKKIASRNLYMHATTEADYEAANEWLNSLGDEIDSEDDIGLSTEASSPSDMYGLGSDSRHATPMSHTMHASMSPIKCTKHHVSQDH